jgi:hypothetical protein
MRFWLREARDRKSSVAFRAITSRQPGAEQSVAMRDRTGCNEVQFVASVVRPFLVNGTKQEWTKSGSHEPLSLVSVQFCLSPQEAQNLTTGEDPLDVSVGDNG